ncbi:MAG: EamA family transporter, partial [Mailhella sp.]|nr:EamA family transporter [Mailhella sp.]
MNDRAKGLFFAITAAALYGLNPLFAVPLYGQGMKPASVLSFRYLLAAAFLVCFMLIQRISLRLSRRQALWLFL